MKRRRFIKKTASASAIAIATPTIVPSSVFGKNAPSNSITIGQIGCGRIARSHDIVETLKYDQAKLIAVSDVDNRRMVDGKKLIEEYYTNKTGKKNAVKAAQLFPEHGETQQNLLIKVGFLFQRNNWIRLLHGI